MDNETKEKVIILLNEARNKISKANIIYQKYEQDNIYLKTLIDLLNEELSDLTINKKQITFEDVMRKKK